MKRFIGIIFILPLLISCDENETIRAEDENKILELAYNSDYQYPDEFYHETISDGSVYYENTISIKPIPEREHIWIELSTNDKNEALSWTNSSNGYSSVNREIISEKETKKYFEFKRQNLNFSNDILLSRIHKTSYFKPELDKFKEPYVVGIYSGELQVDSVKEFIEYIWSCGSLGLGHSKVIESYIKEDNSYFEIYIQSIKIVYGDWGISDYIYVYDNYFKINKNDRILTIDINEMKTIEGHGN